MTETNRKIFHAHGLEEAVSLKHPYYLKQSTDLRQFLLKSQFCCCCDCCFTHRKAYFKFFMERDSPEIAKTILKNRNIRSYFF